MEFKLAQILSDNWLHAIGVTLFHSLWIGVILSVITALIMLVTRKLSASIRYQMLTFCMCLFVVAIAYTFYNEINKDTVVINTVQTVVHEVKPSAQTTLAAAPVAISLSGKVTELMNLWNSYAVQIVWIWFFIIFAKSIHLLLGLNTVYYLKRNKLFDAGRIWENKLKELAGRLDVQQKVQIVQSGIAQVPMVIGHFKPLILIPLGLLNGLSIAEVEAILAHELSHIKRRDYLVNLLQSFIEIIFFFNPAVLWLSKLIKIERENCCDDLALTCVADKKSYVKALLSCQEYQLTTPEYAMALTGRKNQLLNRVSRMLFNTKSTLNKMEKTVLTLSMVFIFLFSAAFRGVENQQNKPLNPQTIQDTTKKKLKKPAPVKKSTTTISKNGKITVINGKVSPIDAETVELTKASEANAQKELVTADKIYKEKLMESDKIYREKAKENEVNSIRYAERDAKYASNNANYNRNESIYKRDAQRYEAAKAQYGRDAKRYRADSANYERAAKRYQQVKEGTEPLAPPSPAPLKPLKPALTTPEPLKPMRSSIGRQAPPAIPGTPVPVKSIRSSVGGQVPATPEPPANVKPIRSAVGEQVPPASPAPIKSIKNSTKSTKSISMVDAGGVDGDELTEKMNSDLLKDGIIKTTKKLSYKLDRNELLVNGVKQADDLHKKYQSKFLKSATTALMYNFDFEFNPKID